MTAAAASTPVQAKGTKLGSPWSRTNRLRPHCRACARKTKQRGWRTPLGHSPCGDAFAATAAVASAATVAASLGRTATCRAHSSRRTATYASCYSIPCTQGRCRSAYTSGLSSPWSSSGSRKSCNTQTTPHFGTSVLGAHHRHCGRRWASSSTHHHRHCGRRWPSSDF